MSSDPTSPHATQLRNHWYWRPGWSPHRRFYTWHITFEGQHELHRLVTTYQAALRDIPGLDLVPLRWLHLTMQGVGFTDEVQPEEARVIANAASKRLARLSPVELTFDQSVIRPEAIAFQPSPAPALTKIRDEIRDGMAELWGDGVPEASKGYEPHVTVAYANIDAPAARTLRALTGIASEPVQVTVDNATLIVLSRDQHIYRWKPFTYARLKNDG